MNNNIEEKKIEISEEEKLSPILENYLKIIFQEELEYGVARTGAIAEQANVSSSTVTSALKSLKKMGFVSYHPYKYIKLTELGKKIAKKIVHKHLVFNEFFTSILFLDQKKSHQLACDLEHLFDPEAFKQFSKFVLYTVKQPNFLQGWQNNCQEDVQAKNK